MHFKSPKEKLTFFVGVLGWFNKKDDGDIEIIEIPHDAKILDSMRPYRTLKLVNVPIGISGCGDAEDCKQDTWTGIITFPLRIRLENHGIVTLMDFFKAIYDFYHFQITRDEYKQLIGLTKKKERETYFSELKSNENENNNENNNEKKFLREWWAGSMYFEGYDPRSKTIEYGT